MKVYKTDKYVGSLPSFMFDTDRCQQLRNLVAYYNIDKVEQPIVVREEIDFSECYIDVSGCDEIESMLSSSHKKNIAEHIRRCFLFFFRNTTWKESGTYYLLEYRGRSIEIMTVVVKSFFFHQVYNDLSRCVKVEEDDQNGVLRDAPVIPMRQEANDGQMKIMVDAILTIDAIEKKENLNILIVGSSHDPRAVARSSYEPLYEMVSKSKFDLYDAVEVPGESQINSNQVVRHAEYYSYQGIEEYDVLLDDAWSHGSPAFRSELFGTATFPEHYSIKAFDSVFDSNVYYQVSKTTTEMRIVSRPILPVYRPERRLGNCPFCLELKFYLMGHYGDSFYKSILRQHKNSKCTPPEWYNEIHSIHQQRKVVQVDWELVPSTKFEVSEYSFIIHDEKLPIRRLVFGEDLSMKLQAVELRKEHLRLCAVVIDNLDHMVSILHSAGRVYYYDGRDLRKKVNIAVGDKGDIKKMVAEQSARVMKDKQTNKFRKNQARAANLRKDFQPLSDAPMYGIRRAQERRDNIVERAKQKYG